MSTFKITSMDSFVEVVRGLSNVKDLSITYKNTREGETSLREALHNGIFSINNSISCCCNTKFETHYTYNWYGNAMLFAGAFNCAAINAESRLRVEVIAK